MSKSLCFLHYAIHALVGKRSLLKDIAEPHVEAESLSSAFVRYGDALSTCHGLGKSAHGIKKAADVDSSYFYSALATHGPAVANDMHVSRTGYHARLSPAGNPDVGRK